VVYVIRDQADIDFMRTDLGHSAGEIFDKLWET
jgi:hypothetical protein